MLNGRANNHIFSKKGPFKAIVYIVLWSFLFSMGGGEYLVGNAWAARTSLGPTAVGLDRTDSPGSFKELNVEAFAIPQYLGHIKDTFKGTSDKAVIHIQDAHCNYAAQHKVSDLIEYFNKEYGIDTINLEGGKGDYDLSIFTRIQDKNIREKVADYFVKEGLVNGAEYFAINNPTEINLWGVEDTALYLESLDIYRESISHKEEIEKYLKELNHILSNLKRRIYSGELLEFDSQYVKHKSNTIEFKEYLTYLINKAKEKAINLKSFTNIYLLYKSLEQEEEIDFRAANSERNKVIDKLQKILSLNELEELVAKTIEFKTEKLSQKDFYAYLIKKAKTADFDLKQFPGLRKYIVYISTYEAIDKSKLMEEIDVFESRIKESIYQNQKQRELDILSKNLTLTKNIFEIILTKEDYEYYRDNEGLFDTRNYTAFINKEAPLYKISARLDKNIEKLDQYRRNISRFYECSFKRDKAFLKNIKFIESSPNIVILVTGGFHTDNLFKLFKKNNVSYISILPNFKNGDGYKSPYFSLLAGKETELQKEIYPILASASAYSMQIASWLSEALGAEVWGAAGVSVNRAAVVIREEIERGNKIIGIERQGDNVVFSLENESGEVEKITVSVARFLKWLEHEEKQDAPIRRAYQAGRYEDVEKDVMHRGAREEAASRLRNIANGMNDQGKARRLNALADQIENGQIAINLVDVGDAAFDAHPGGQGIHVNMKHKGNRNKIVDLIVHEAIGGIAGDHFIALDAEQGRVELAAGKLDDATLLAKAVWDMTPEERLGIDRDFAAIPEEALMRHLGDLQDRRDISALHRTLKLIAASINKNPAILQQRGAMIDDQIRDTLERLGEYTGENATEIIQIAQRETDYDDIRIQLSALSQQRRQASQQAEGEVGERMPDEESIEIREDSNETDPIRRFTPLSDYFEMRAWRHVRYGSMQTEHKQGWKLHVAATPKNAAAILKLVLPILHKHKVAHKVINGVEWLQKVNKGDDPTYGNTQVGKFIAIYTESKTQAEMLAKEIDLALRDKGFEIPNKLSWNAEGSEGDKLVKGGMSGLVGYRYGSYTDYHVELPSGERVGDVRDKYKHPMIMQTMTTMSKLEGLETLGRITSRKEQLENWKDRLEKGKFKDFAAIGDVHGDLERLKQMIDNLEAEGVHRFVFCGDFMDRGEENLEVIKFVRKLKEQGKAILLFGNHDLWFLQAMLGDIEAFAMWIANGGLEVLNEAGIDVEDLLIIGKRARSLGLHPAQALFEQISADPQRIDLLFADVQKNAKLKEIATWMQNNLKLFHVNEEGILFIHAGIPLDQEGNVALEHRGYKGIEALKALEEELKNASSVREPIFDALNAGSSPLLVRRGWLDRIGTNGAADMVLDQLGVNGIVFGHSPQDDLLNVQNKIFGIDLALAKAMGGQGGNLVFGQNGLVLNRLNGREANKIEVLSKTALIKDLEARIERLDHEGKTKVVAATGVPSNELIEAAQNVQTIYDEFILGLNEAEQKLIVGIVAAFETQDLGAARSFLADRAPLAAQYINRDVMDKYLKLRRENINLFRILRLLIMQENAQTLQFYFSVARNLREKTNVLSEKLVGIDTLAALEVLSIERRNALSNFIDTLTPKQKKLIVAMSLAQKLSAIARLLLAQDANIEELGLGVSPEIIDSYLRMREDDMEQFRILRYLVVPKDKIDIYSEEARDLADKTNMLNKGLLASEKTGIEKGQITNEKDILDTFIRGLNPVEKKLLVGIMLSLNSGEGAKRFLALPDSLDVLGVSITPGVIQGYMELRKDIERFRAIRDQAIPASRHDEYSTAARSLRQKTDILNEQLKAAAEASRTIRKTELDKDERKLIHAMLLGLDGKFDRAVNLLMASGDVPEVTPNVARRYLSERGRDVDNLRTVRREIARRLRQRLPALIEVFFGDHETSVMNRLKLQKEDAVKNIALAELPTSRIDLDGLRQHLLDLHRQAEQSGDATTLHRTIKLITACINDDPNVLVERGSISSVRIRDILNRLGELDLTDARRIIDIANRGIDYNPILKKLAQFAKKTEKPKQDVSYTKVYIDLQSLEHDISVLQTTLGERGLGNLPKVGFHGEQAGHKLGGEFWYFILDPNLSDYWRPEWRERRIEAMFALRTGELSMSDVFMGQAEFFERLQGTIIFNAKYAQQLSEGILPEIYVLVDAPSENFELRDASAKEDLPNSFMYDPQRGNVNYRFFNVEGHLPAQDLPSEAIRTKISLTQEEFHAILNWAKANGRGIMEVEFFVCRLLFKKALEQIISITEIDQSPFGLADGGALAQLTERGIQLREDIPMSSELLFWNVVHEQWHETLNNERGYGELTQTEKEVLAVILAFRGIEKVQDRHLMVLLRAFGVEGDEIPSLSNADFVQGIVDYFSLTRPGYSAELGGKADKLADVAKRIIQRTEAIKGQKLQLARAANRDLKGGTTDIVTMPGSKLIQDNDEHFAVSRMINRESQDKFRSDTVVNHYGYDLDSDENRRSALRKTLQKNINELRRRIEAGDKRARHLAYVDTVDREYAQQVIGELAPELADRTLIIPLGNIPIQGIIDDVYYVDGAKGILNAQRHVVGEYGMDTRLDLQAESRLVGFLGTIFDLSGLRNAEGSLVDIGNPSEVIKVILNGASLRIKPVDLQSIQDYQDRQAEVMQAL